MLLWMVYIRGEVSVVGPEQMKDLLMSDPIYGIVWSLFICAIVTWRKSFPLFLLQEDWKQNVLVFVTRIGRSWCCFWIVKLITPESSFADVQRKIECSNSIISHWNQSVIVEHRASCFYTLDNFWLWNDFCIWTIPKLCHVEFSTVEHRFQSAHEHNILVMHSLWIHRILFCSCSSLHVCFLSAPFHILLN